MKNSLAEKSCQPCRENTPALTVNEAAQLLPQLAGWNLDAAGHLHKRYRFPDFAQALAFVNRVGALAEAQDHHPNIELSWGRVALTLWTHSVNGLSENDFILAAKIDHL